VAFDLKPQAWIGKHNSRKLGEGFASRATKSIFASVKEYVADIYDQPSHRIARFEDATELFKETGSQFLLIALGLGGLLLGLLRLGLRVLSLLRS
jgi:hypothetical protein